MQKNKKTSTKSKENSQQTLDKFLKNQTKNRSGSCDPSNSRNTVIVEKTKFLQTLEDILDAVTLDTQSIRPEFTKELEDAFVITTVFPDDAQALTRVYDLPEPISFEMAMESLPVETLSMDWESSRVPSSKFDEKSVVPMDWQLSSDESDQTSENMDTN